MTHTRKDKRYRKSIRSVDEFLARRASRGPREPRRAWSEFTSHESADLDIKFLLALVRHRHRLARTVCVPQFVACGYSHTTVRHARHTCAPDAHMRVRANVIVSDLRTTRPTLWLPPDLPAQVAECRKRFVVCSLGLYDHRDFATGHANALVFDVRRRLIERFEPLGDRHMPWLARWLTRRLETAFPGWRYFGTHLSAPGGAGVQTRADGYDGLCVTFSLLYVLLRLLNPEKTAMEINDHLVSGYTPHELRSVVLRLNRHAADVLRAHRNGSLG